MLFLETNCVTNILWRNCRPWNLKFFTQQPRTMNLAIFYHSKKHKADRRLGQRTVMADSELTESGLAWWTISGHGTTLVPEDTLCLSVNNSISVCESLYCSTISQFINCYRIFQRDGAEPYTSTATTEFWKQFFLWLIVIYWLMAPKEPQLNPLQLFLMGNTEEQSFQMHSRKKRSTEARIMMETLLQKIVTDWNKEWWRKYVLHRWRWKKSS